MRKTTFKDPIYFNTIVVIVCSSLSEIAPKYNITKPLDKYSAITFKAKNGSWIMAFNEVTPEIISHEISHLVNYVFDECGIQLDSVNDEPQAYYTGFITKKVYKAIYPPQVINLLILANR